MTPVENVVSLILYTQFEEAPTDAIVILQA